MRKRKSNLENSLEICFQANFKIKAQFQLCEFSTMVVIQEVKSNKSVKDVRFECPDTDVRGGKEEPMRFLNREKEALLWAGETHLWVVASASEAGKLLVSRWREIMYFVCWEIYKG